MSNQLTETVKKYKSIVQELRQKQTQYESERRDNIKDYTEDDFIIKIRNFQSYINQTMPLFEQTKYTTPFEKKESSQTQVLTNINNIFEEIEKI